MFYFPKEFQVSVLCNSWKYSCNFKFVDMSLQDESIHAMCGFFLFVFFRDMTSCISNYKKKLKKETALYMFHNIKCNRKTDKT